MKLDINQVYHNYITKVVIFSLFTFKRSIRQPSFYKLCVKNYTTKRIPWKIDLEIDIEEVSKKKQRKLILDELLEGIESKTLSLITVKFTTPLKETIMIIDLSDELKYEKYIYS